MCQEKEDVVTYRATKFITVIYADAAGASAEITIESETTVPSAKRRAEADEDFNVLFS